jgi:hypothetical protein
MLGTIIALGLKRSWKQLLGFTGQGLQMSLGEEINQKAKAPKNS